MNFHAAKIMGVINVTPDSFSDGGVHATIAGAVEHGCRLADEGAHILDIGGESTRPGAALVSDDEEIERVLPVVEALCAKTDAIVSIDTRKSAVAKAAIGAGARIWNDVSALSFEDESIQTAASLSCDIVLMHAQGVPQTMQDNPSYVDVVMEVKAYLAGRAELCVAAGIDRSRLIIDPGIGFGKTLDHNLALLAGLAELKSLNLPLLVGASRKRMIAALDRDGPAAERLGGSVAAALEAVRSGADIVRVHDVAQTRQALAVAGSIRDGKS